MKKEKKIVLLISGIGGGLFLVFLIALLNNLCGGYRRICMEIYTPIAYFCFSFPLLFFLSLITYKMRDEIFRSWIRFAYVFVPLSIFLTFLASNSRGGTTGIPNILSQEFIAFFLSFVFLLISFIIIIYKSIKLRGK